MSVIIIIDKQLKVNSHTHTEHVKLTQILTCSSSDLTVSIEGDERNGQLPQVKFDNTGDDVDISVL